MRHLSALTLCALILWLGQHPAAACPTPELLIEHMARAHGGLDAWRSMPTVRFEDEFVPAGAEAGTPSVVTVQQGSRRAYIDFPGTEMRMSWDGERAWSRNWASPYPPRFLALLNYHFANLPWLAHDPGVVLSEFGTGNLPDDPTEYQTVKITYESRVGDTPRDYYRLFIDPETHLLKATQYIVTYRELLPEGADASPQNTLIYDAFETVDGLVVPTQYTIYNSAGEVYFRCAFRNWSFSADFDEGRMAPSEQDVIDESTP